MKIITISAIWCPSCLVMRPRFEAITKKYPSIDYKTYDYDLDDGAKSYHPGNILPVFILIDKDNNECGRLIGEHSVNDLLELIEIHSQQGGQR